MKISALTWHRDSHGLFDFEANLYKKHQLIVDGTGLLTRQLNDDTISFVEPRFIKHYINQPA
jgi:hypothetical protein